ncbi:PD-(D/E)XK nuclease family protein [Acidimicrobiia bacterium]|jgi:putative RecB family exonuclease|nr:PD-(D/E)XK nuclease family protein [Acidimicrobiia bacterium]MDB2532400.1 PD-(D/E)XK nuclease family protein [Candidatus Actinomarina sp.]MDA9860001.1 PD-(D/E)XK nuclease family protein [Acidimicrobiia bacterium]MDB0017440.1 PD-(D/E)XK nuclease family protein [Acidimicrobiia bacterium]MDB4833086.1 PD-(D/E)XK nuclease family protein [Acidimicrobiia bacterium]|tara:strand:- start:10730 stop:11704 length:975 start_codon:yes stop_codon:yes gene_type:complete
MIKNLSPSRASQFKTCPKQFKFSNVDKIKEPTNLVQAKGTTVHQALEDLYDLPIDQRTPEVLYDLFRKAWSNVRGNDEHVNLFDSIEDEREWGQEGLNLLHNYLKLEDPQKLEPLEQERWVRGSIEDLNLRGILDRMDEDKDGNLIIVDYKSGKAPMAKYKEPRFFALKLYALLIRDEIGVTPKELKLIYLKNSTIHTLKIDDTMLDEAKVEILSIWQDIKNAFENNEFPATKNALCKDWCYYKPICPLFNKEAPSTDKLREIVEKIAEINETLDALEMFENQDELPDSSPLKNININELKDKIFSLEGEKERILTDINSLLGK